MQIPEDYHLINLLPPEVEAERTRRRIVFGLFGGLALLVIILGFLWFQRVQQVNKVDRDIRAQLKTNTDLQAEIKKYDEIEAKNKRLLDTEGRYRDAVGGEVSWFRFIQDVAANIPAQDWLVNFTASGGGGAPSGRAVTAMVAAGGLVNSGTFSVGGKDFDRRDAADGLVRISQLAKVADLWVSSSSKDTTGGQSTVSFASSGSLTQDSWTPRAKRAERGDYYGGPD